MDLDEKAARDSHLLQEWLREMTGRKIYLTAPTHVAANNLRVEGLEPMTLCRFWNRYLKQGTGLHKDCTIVIDEVSQVSTLFWHRLTPLSRLCQVICCGNPEDQLLAVADSFLDVPLEIDVSGGQLLRSVCGPPTLAGLAHTQSCTRLR